MRLIIVTTITALTLLLFIVEMLRRRQLQEKYALLWLTVSVVVLPLAVFPRLPDQVAKAIGVQSGVSLVLFLAIVFLLLVCMHLTWEVSRLEEETRVLAEEVALIRTDIAAGRADGSGLPGNPSFTGGSVSDPIARQELIDDQR